MDELLAEQFESHRSHLRAVAYRMLGSVSEADDAVQEGWIKFSRADTTDVVNLGGWLTTVVSRVCLDLLRSRGSRREESLEAHLPDPIVSTTEGVDPEYEALNADAVGLALLVVLDTLNPAERVAFVLHDLFSVPFDRIAPVVDRSADATKMIASRARRRSRSRPPDRTPTCDASGRSSRRFVRLPVGAGSRRSSRCSIPTSSSGRIALRASRSYVVPRRWRLRRSCSPGSARSSRPPWSSTASPASSRSSTARCSRYSRSRCPAGRSPRSTSWRTPPASPGWG